MTKYRTTEDYALALEELNPVWKVVGHFQTLTTAIHHECIACGFVDIKRPTTVIHLKSACSNCKRKQIRDDYIARLREINPRVEARDPFVSVLHSIRHECLDCHRIWKAQPRLLLSGTGCQCQLKHSNEEYAARLLEKGGIIALENYKGVRIAIKHRHTTCGFEWMMSPGSILHQGTRCPECAPFRQAGRARPEQVGENWFHSSFEADCYKLLLGRFNPSDIQLQKRYLPDSKKTCDFYIKSRDLHIEVSTIRKVWYYERILNKRRLVDNFYFAGSLQQLQLFLDGLSQ